MDSKVMCQICSISISKTNISRHYKQVHGVKLYVRKAPSNFFCDVCPKAFTGKIGLKKHLKRKHFPCVEESGQSMKNRNIRCPICGEVFTRYSVFDDHLTKSHNIETEHYTQEFANYEEFKTYKDNLEKNQTSFFTLDRKNPKQTYYACHRSGFPKAANDDSRNMRFRKSVKSVKIGATCPARIVVTRAEERVIASFQLKHVGHVCSVEFLRLTRKERLAIAAKLDMGVPFNKILFDIRQSVQSGVERIHLVNKRDLMNIVRDFNLKRDVYSCNNDLIKDNFCKPGHRCKPSITIASSVSCEDKFEDNVEAMLVSKAAVSKLPNIGVVDPERLGEKLLAVHKIRGTLEGKVAASLNSLLDKILAMERKKVEKSLVPSQEFSHENLEKPPRFFNSKKKRKCSTNLVKPTDSTKEMLHIGMASNCEVTNIHTENDHSYAITTC